MSLTPAAKAAAQAVLDKVAARLLEQDKIQQASQAA